MKQKFAILTDTACNLDINYCKENNIHVFPFGIIFSDRTYLDKKEIDNDLLYKRMEVEIPTTSIPSPGEMMEIIESILSEGYEKVLIITIASGLSSLNSMINLMKKEIFKDKIMVLDSLNVSMPQGFFAIHANELRNQGKTIEEAYEILESKINKSRFYAVVGTLDYLVKGGRINKITGTFGSVLNIKPIITTDETGKIMTCAKSRGHIKAVEKLAELIKADLHGVKNYYFTILPGKDQEYKDSLSEMLSEEIANAKLFLEENITSIVGVHSGPDVLGVGYFILD